MKLSRFFKYIKLLNIYPPFLGAGIRLKEVSNGGRGYRVEMKLRWYNRNVYGSHFGGSLYAMCDPWFVFSAYSYFGDDYILWDKSAAIKFVKPGRSKVWAYFEIPKQELESMKKIVDKEGKQTFTFTTNVYNLKEEVVAIVVKEIYIRKAPQN